MPNKRDRFTQGAWRALSLAQEEAERLHHNSIGTEHLLLGLIRVDSGVAHQVFGDLIIAYVQLSMLVAELSPMGQRTPNTAMDLSAETKHVLERAVVEARNMNHNYIGTEHLLLALVHKPDTITAEILKRLQITADDIRQGVDRVLGRDENVLRPVVTPLASRMRTYVSRAMSGPTPPNIEVMKILQLVEDGKITAQQSEKLLQALPPTSASLPQSGRVQRAAAPKDDPRQVRILLNDQRTQAVHLDFTLPVVHVQDRLANLLEAIEEGIAHYTLHFSSTDHQYQIDVYMDDRHEQSGEEAS